MSPDRNDPLSLAQAAAERAQRRAATRKERRAARDIARVLGRAASALAAGKVGRARDLLVGAAGIAAQLPGTPALQRNIDDALALLQSRPQPSETIPTGWRPTGVLAGPGDLGPWAKVLGGSISPCSFVEFAGRRLLYVVGARGRRQDDGGPAWRSLGAVELDDAGRFVMVHQGVIEHFPSKGLPGDEEEGIFSAVPVVDGDELRLYVGEVTLTGPGNVDVRTARYTSRDGLRFRRDETLSERAGAEIGPVAAWSHGGRDFIVEFHKQVPGWGDWQLGVNSDPVQPRVSAVGASGPFPVGERLALCVVTWDSTPGDPVPTLVWYSLDPARPTQWRREDAPPLPIAHEVAIAPDMSQAWALDSWQTEPARIVRLQRTDSGDPIETAAPHVLRSDPRAWPVLGELASVRWSSVLEIQWRGMDRWRHYVEDGRALYGHLCAVVRDAAGRWVITGFEHLANAPGAPFDVLDTRFEHLAEPVDLGLQMQLPGKRFERGEELYLFAAAPCRIGGGARYPQDVGLVPVRTRIARVRFGVDGVEDAEPSTWWT